MNPFGATHAYIGLNNEGDVRAICIDDPGYEKQTGKIVGEWIAMGRTIERLPIDIAKARACSPSAQLTPSTAHDERERNATE